MIDFHTHISRRRAQKRRAAGGPLEDHGRGQPAHDGQPDRRRGEDLAVRDRNFDRAFPRRFVSMTEPTWARAGEPGYAAWQADEIAQGEGGGRRGVKVLKTLGLYLREAVPRGRS